MVVCYGSIKKVIQVVWVSPTNETISELTYENETTMPRSGDKHSKLRDRNHKVPEGEMNRKA